MTNYVSRFPLTLTLGVPRSAALYDDEGTARTDGQVLERVRRVKRIRRSPYYGRAERKYFDEEGKTHVFRSPG